jgi:hypothetical protein
MAFTVAVIVNTVAVVQGKYSTGVGLLAVFPLALLLVTVCTCSRCRMPPSGEAGESQLNGRPHDVGPEAWGWAAATA